MLSMFKKPRISVLLVVIAISAFACKKENWGEASGDLNNEESALFVHLPADAQIAFGGSYERFMEYWDNSPLKDLAAMMPSLDPKGGHQMTEYMNCWVENGRTSKLAGTLAFRGQALEMSMVFGGLAAETLKTCVKKSGFEIAEDADGKYVEIKGVPDGMGGTSSVGYYFLDPKTVLFSMTLPVGMGGGMPKSPTRPELEAITARAKSASAASSAEVKALIAMADRSKAFWFAGSSAGTPAADVVKTGNGWFDTTKTAMTFGFTVELVDPQAASAAVTAFDSAADQLATLPPDLQSMAKDFLKSAKLKNDGGVLKGRFKLENSLLEKLIPFVKQMSGM